ncbi:MAG TPA: heme biosynthesis HemY N-terminal domain-containing protein [Aromatoleum sp.]|uniref:heme biosynthesis HemY N-terminal domain-containing protein n=1 Tax=Aromatoleum sp. TaxID=2307007 RepID=UPI002B4A9639|nr:heme biosynthesis HemY N-terminal domain-containing protein [Aromatoleum sp.]HJV27092.1 heme biosynthesis HemY N-terminal domain-containing protein [Aromatoleum sp.]
MRALIWLIGIFALAVGGAMLASINTGYVLLVLPPWRMQLSLNLLIVILVLGFVLTYGVLRVVSKTLALPGRVGVFRERRRKEVAGRALRDAVRALFEGRFSQSVKLAESAFNGGEAPTVSALVAARAAHAMRDDTRYRIWIGRATETEGESRVARLMTEAELAVEGRHFNEAAERLESLRLAGQRHIAALRLSLRVASALAQWEEVIRLARQLRKHRALSGEQAQLVLRRAHIERFRELAGDGDGLAAYWRAIPADELNDRRLVERAVPLMASAGQGALVRKTLERLLETEWDSGLARLYAHCGGDEAVECLARAEKWLVQHPKDGGLLFALGRLCSEAQLWGKAQSYLEVSLNLAPTIETHLALAGLLERLDRAEDAQVHYRAAAQLVAAS